MLKYHGEIKDVHSQLGEYGERVTRAIDKVLGLRLFQRLQAEAERLIVPETFRMPDRRLDMMTTTANDAMFVCEVDFGDISNLVMGDDGTVAEMDGKTIITKPRIIITEEGIENAAKMIPEYSHLAPLTTLLHESLHFTMYVLQSLPIRVGEAILTRRLQDLGISSNSPEEIFRQLNEKSRLPFENLMALSTFDETLAHVFHAAIYEEMGMKDAWWVFRKIYDSDQMLQDQFDRTGEKVRSDIDSLIRYHKSLRNGIPPYTKNFLSSLGKVKVERNPVEK